MEQYAITRSNDKHVVSRVENGNLLPVASVNSFRYATVAAKQMNYDFKDTEFDASEAADHVLNPSASFGSLNTGALFHFPGTPVIWQKTKSGYKAFTHNPGITWKTGARTAVVHIGQRF